MNRMPVIAIVGRPNVGKSSLLNALIRKRISIVQDMPGVTRDRISIPMRLRGRYVELVDTGGYGFVDPDALTDHIRHQIELAMSLADLVLFVVDCQSGLTAADEQIAALLRKQGIRTVLLANKADGPKADAMLGEFARLGLGTPIGISALNHRNIDQAIDTIADNVNLDEAPTSVPEPEMHVAIVGKRNAGKSTLVNTIARVYEGNEAGGDRVIVSEVPGTTRDSIDVRIQKEGHALTVIDTAGVRKKRHMVTNDIEFYSFHRAQRSVRRADVVMLLVDATEPVSEPDKKLAQYIATQFKPVILVINKWDLARQRMQETRQVEGRDMDDRELMEKYREYIAAEMPWLAHAPLTFVTASEGRNVQVVLDLAQRLFKQSRIRVTTSRLNTAVRQILQERTPSTASGRRAKIFYATQVDSQPPTIVLVVNKPEYVDETYQRFVVNRFREKLPFKQVPMRLLVRSRSQRTEPGAPDQPLDEDLGPPPPPTSRPRPKGARGAGLPKQSPRRSSAQSRSKRPPRGR